MIVWGGLAETGFPTNTGGRYNPATDSWTATSTTNAPTARQIHTAVWTGSEMIVWGGIEESLDISTPAADTIQTRTAGSATSTTNAPLPELVTRQSGPAVK